MFPTRLLGILNLRSMEVVGESVSPLESYAKLFVPLHFSREWYQFSSVAQLCPTLCDPMDCSTPGLRVHHQLPEPAQTHVHRVGDAIQPSHPLSSPSPPAFSLSQHRGLFQGVISSRQVAKVLELQLQKKKGTSASASVLPKNI